MNSINTQISNSSYYQLSNSSAGNGGTSNSSSATTALLQALNQSSAGSTGTGSPAYSLDLSTEAQNYLGGLSGTSSTSTTTTGGSDTFQLSTKQQQELTAILAKYKDAPYTQATFNSIQNDLNAAGLGTSTLQAQDQAKSFNPIVTLIDYLNGNSAAGDASVPTSSQEQTKSSNFMQSVIQQWKSISTTYDPTSSASGTSASGVTAVSSTGGA